MPGNAKKPNAAKYGPCTRDGHRQRIRHQDGPRISTRSTASKYGQILARPPHWHIYPSNNISGQIGQISALYGHTGNLPPVGTVAARRTFSGSCRNAGSISAFKLCPIFDGAGPGHKYKPVGLKLILWTNTGLIRAYAPLGHNASRQDAKKEASYDAS